MGTKRNISQQPLHINANADGNRPIVLHPEDDDLFIRTGRQVIEACQLGIGIGVWLEEIHSLLEAVGKWAADHHQHVRACYASPRGGSIGLYFVPRSNSYDFDLADKLAPMNREWVNQFNVGMIEIHQLPENQVDRFILPNTKRIVFPNDRIPHQAVEA